MGIDDFGQGVLGLAGSLHKTFLNFDRVARLKTRLLNGLSWFEPGGGGVLPMMAHTERLRPKGVSFSGFRYMKG